MTYYAGCIFVHINERDFMQRLICSLILAVLACFSVLANDAGAIQWSEEDYHILHGDFDGDGKLDSTIISKSPNQPSYLFSDVGTANITTEHWIHYTQGLQYLVSGDFDNDQQDEILVLDKELSGWYWDFAHETGFYEGEEKLKISGYSKNRQIDFTHLYRGRFNGDSSDDLLAYAADTHDIVVFHNKQKTNKIKFKFDAQLYLSNSAPMSLRISDFNGDGQEDIALLSTMSGGSSYIAFAGNKGKFKKSDFEEITPYLEGIDWNTGQHSIHLWSNTQQQERQIIRLANAQGGIDEEGNIITGNGQIEANTGVSVLSDPQDCQHLTYSPLSKTLSQACLTGCGDADGASIPDGSKPLAQSAGLRPSAKPAPGMESAATSVGVPSWVSATIWNGNDITVSWGAVSGATSYNREVSVNGGAWKNKRSYPGSQTVVTFYDQQTRSYQYRVQACIGEDCGNWKTSSTVTVQPTPSIPATPTNYPGVSGGSYHPINSVYTVNISSVSGATRYEVYVGTSSTNVRYESGGSGYSHSIPAGSNHGYRYIKYKACNAAGCSGLSPYRRIYIYTTPGSPNNVSINKTSVNFGGSATVSWTNAEGMVPAGTYRLYETKPGHTETQIASITAGSGSSYSHPVYPNGNVGSYTYRVRGCNPSMGCGGSKTVSTTLVNLAPIADDESLQVDEGQSASVNVLSGDYDPDGHSISIVGYGQGSKGSVSCSGSSCTYTSTTSITADASDSFDYTISDGYGGQDKGTVSVTIKNTNLTVCAAQHFPQWPYFRHVTIYNYYHLNQRCNYLLHHRRFNTHCFLHPVHRGICYYLRQNNKGHRSEKWLYKQRNRH